MFFLHIRRSATTVFGCKGPKIQFLQFHPDRFFGLSKSKETLVPQRSKHPCGGEFDRPLCVTLIFGILHTGRNDGGTVILRQFLITTVQYSLVARIFGYACFEVVWDEQTSDTAEILVGVNMAMWQADQFSSFMSTVPSPLQGRTATKRNAETLSPITES